MHRCEKQNKKEKVAIHEISRTRWAAFVEYPIRNETDWPGKRGLYFKLSSANAHLLALMCYSLVLRSLLRCREWASTATTREHNKLFKGAACGAWCQNKDLPSATAPRSAARSLIFSYYTVNMIFLPLCTLIFGENPWYVFCEYKINGPIIFSQSQMWTFYILFSTLIHFFK